MDVKLGEEIGYKFRGKNLTNQKGKKSKIFFTTDGSILAQMLGSDPDLTSINALIIDEVHKRSPNIDLLLLLIKSLVQRRSDFKLILVSATIDIELFRKYYPAPTFRFAAVDISSGPINPITEHWLTKPIPLKADSYVKEAVQHVNRILRETDKGDILVFLGSNADLTNACELLEDTNKEKKSFCVTASSAVLAASGEQKDIVAKHQKDNPKRKVIMSTNVAEESITIENVDFVIDTGVMFKNVYDPYKMVDVMDRKYVTKASVKQRIGRTGRVSKGTAYHLYTKEQFEEFADYELPEIKTMDLSAMFLQIMNLSFIQTYQKALSFLNDLIEPPDLPYLVSAIRQLEALGCFTKGISGGTSFKPNLEDLGEITVTGKIMARLPFKPRVAKSLLMAHHYMVRVEAMFLYTILEACSGKMDAVFFIKRRAKELPPDILPFLHPKGDYLTLLNVYHAYENVYKENLPDDAAFSAMTKEEKETAKNLARKKTWEWGKKHHVQIKTLEKVKEA